MLLVSDDAVNRNKLFLSVERKKKKQRRKRWKNRNKLCKTSLWKWMSLWKWYYGRTEKKKNQNENHNNENNKIKEILKYIEIKRVFGRWKSIIILRIFWKKNILVLYIINNLFIFIWYRIIIILYICNICNRFFSLWDIMSPILYIVKKKKKKTIVFNIL